MKYNTIWTNSKKKADRIIETLKRQGRRGYYDVFIRDYTGKAMYLITYTY